MIRTGEEYRESIKDGREVYIAGNNEAYAISLKLPRSQQDWWNNKNATDVMMNKIGGVVTRVADETAGEMRSLYDAQTVLNEVNPEFADNIKNHLDNVVNDPFHVTANIDPKGDRLTFQEFARLATVYHHFDFDGPIDLVRQAAGLSKSVQSNKLTKTNVAVEHGAFLGTTADNLNRKI